MKKTILLASIILGGIVSAQNSNEELKIQLQEDNDKSNIKFDFYKQRKLSQLLANDEISLSMQDSIRTQLEDEKSRLAFFFGGRPYFLKLKDTDQISNANVDYIQEGNIAGLGGSFNGEGIKVAVFDGGRAYEKHDDFGGENSTRVNNKEASTVIYDSHATAVTGIIGAQGHTLEYSDGTIAGNTKGMMPLATFDNYSFGTTTLAGETQSKNVIQKVLGALPYLSNHSYGTTMGWEYQSDSPAGWYWNGEYDPNTKQYISLEGAYLSRDKNYDDIVYNNPSVIIVKAAGNEFGDGPQAGENKYYYKLNLNNDYVPTAFDNTDNIPPNTCSDGYDCISSGSLAKNIIVVGATEKITTNDGRYAQSGDVKKASFSSAGPRDDGGIKPDIAGVGENILAPSTTTRGATRWEYFGEGTSYSTPQVTGIIGLWTEINKTLFNQEFNAASAKNLLIHTAQEAGNIGPDAWYGWGLADAKAGAELLVQKSNNKVIFEDKTLQNGSTDKILVDTNGAQPLKVSISWIDPSFKNLPNTDADANNNRTSVLVNDLDLRITNLKTGQIFYPWKLDINNPLAPAIKGDNLVDNVEQVLIENPTAGTYKIEVSHKGTLVNNNGNNTDNQNYSIIATGYTRITSEQEYINNNTHPLLIVSPTLLIGNENEIKIDTSNKNIESVSLYDMAGRLLKSEKASILPYLLDFSNLPKAAYVIDIEHNGKKESIKVLKR